jgi:hypothetical protein
MGRSHQHRSDFRTRFSAHVETIREERDDNDLFNRLGRCPYPDCNYEVSGPGMLHALHKDRCFQRACIPAF